jgi:PAS domain S-box-containing protein
MDRAGQMLAKIDIGVLGRTMLDAARAARIGVTITLVDSPRPRNIYVSDAAANILGWSIDELLESDPMEHIAPEDLPRMSDRLQRRTSGELGENTSEMVAIRKDGGRVPIEVTASPVSIDGRRAVFAFMVDVSARKAAEQQRLRNEARFRELIESAPDPIGIIRAGRFVYANRAFVVTLGLADAQALYETPMSSLLEPEDAAIRDVREAAILERGVRTPPLTYHVRRGDGSAVLLEVSSVYFEYEGQPSVLTMGRDITARRRLEMQLVQAERLAALGTLAAGVAHEINNPLAYVMLNLEWIARKLPGVADEPASVDGLMAMLDEARDGAKRVSTIVRELRSFSRADGETKHHVDLATVVEAAIKITGHEVRHRARVSTSFEPVRRVWANEARLEQVVINLLMNAAQAVPEARGDDNEIRVTVREDADGRAVLEVADNGNGIPAEVLSRIFDPFFTTKPVGVGTGLGLSICHGIVTSLGGQIAAYSEPGEGAVFRVVLPTTDRRHEDTTRHVADPPPSSVGRRGRVLVVDDEPPIANTMDELLGLEHDVVTASNAREALALVLSGVDFAVIFCDLMMPGMSGVDFYEQLRVQRPGTERKIVFMTGGAFTSRAAEFLASVDNRRIEKPFNLGLVEEIAREMTEEATPAASTR